MERRRGAGAWLIVLSAVAASGCGGGGPSTELRDGVASPESEAAISESSAPLLAELTLRAAQLGNSVAYAARVAHEFVTAPGGPSERTVACGNTAAEGEIGLARAAPDTVITTWHGCMPETRDTRGEGVLRIRFSRMDAGPDVGTGSIAGVAELDEFTYLAAYGGVRVNGSADFDFDYESGESAAGSIAFGWLAMVRDGAAGMTLRDYAIRFADSVSLDTAVRGQSGRVETAAGATLAVEQSSEWVMTATAGSPEHGQVSLVAADGSRLGIVALGAQVQLDVQTGTAVGTRSLAMSWDDLGTAR